MCISLVCPFSLNVSKSRQDVDIKLVMSLTLLFRDTPVGCFHRDIHYRAVVLIIAKRSIIPGEGSPLEYALISVVVVWLAKDSLRSM